MHIPGAQDWGQPQQHPEHDREPARLSMRESVFNDSHVHSVVGPLLAALPPQPPPCLPAYCQHLPTRTLPILSPPPCEAEVRRRGEKRPIPAELKDDKYYERRRRNNQAAKKSRDARRIREDQIAWRACILEQENASLRAHVAALRQEALALRGLLAARDDAPPAPSSTTAD
ncbi:CCAAT/enhancer-binding protein delta-like [Hyposmocoma kahamanoa]|uniref:CCAAT/enhancer-binding protein delta-like n=1 Tax=Hyposmocoma kahamanoa TaxID=1477025 RepID=UPI000E6D7C21|nr:CCAAT/enhancer-binding protein delta-like [Hyposmocoma kahamanoa]